MTRVITLIYTNFNTGMKQDFRAFRPLILFWGQLKPGLPCFQKALQYSLLTRKVLPPGENGVDSKGGK
ncbi:MAG TPA: hypothetical protein DCR87_04485 [Acidobacteria bacterium]|nr:hypothetical protein [Acidobacteriota bacterium]